MDINRSKIKKIAIVAPSMRLVGGQSIQANSLIEAFAGDDEVELSLVPINPPVFFENIKILRTIFTSMKFWKLLFQVISKVDAVQIFSAAGSGYLIATIPPLFIAKLFRKKTILNYHSGELERHIQSWKLTAKPTMKLFDKIVVPSGFLVEKFAEFGLEAVAISNFVDTDKFAFQTRNVLKPVFLSNRNFDSHYNVEDVLRAFQLIQKQIPESELLVAGFGPKEAQLRQLTRQLRLKNVDFLGRIENQNMPEIYSRADIYLNASIVDNMPLSFIEALAGGLPIVSYATGGIPFIIDDGKTGLLVPTGDYKALADKSIWLIENSTEAQKLIQNGRKEVEKYSKAKVKAGWRKFYLD